MVNLVKCYTINGSVYIDTEQLDSGITNLTIYTCRGNRLADTAKTKRARTQAESWVHRDNLFASRDLAEQNYNRVLLAIQNGCRRYADTHPDNREKLSIAQERRQDK